jgi:hypothetical protein
MLVTIAVQAIEVELAILHLYNLINKRLPGWQDAPSRDEIKVWPNIRWAGHVWSAPACTPPLLSVVASAVWLVVNV